MESTCRLFTKARIFDGSGRAPFPGGVLLEKNLIEAVCVSTRTPGTERYIAQKIDAGIFLRVIRSREKET